MKTLIQQATEYKPDAALRKSYKLEQMKPALAALDAISSALLDASLIFDFNKRPPHVENGETVIKPATGSRKDFVQVLKENGFKRAVSAPCFESYTRGKAILRVYW